METLITLIIVLILINMIYVYLRIISRTDKMNKSVRNMQELHYLHSTDKYILKDSLKLLILLAFIYLLIHFGPEYL